MLKKTGPLLWIHEEQRDIAAMAFRFKDKETPRSYISSIVRNIHVCFCFYKYAYLIAMILF